MEALNRRTTQFAVNAEADRLMTVREVATLTGLAVGTIYHLISQKRVPVVRLSRRCVRVRLSDLLRWWDEMTQLQEAR